MTLLIITSIAAFIATLIFTVFVKKIAWKFQICAKANHRSIHKQTVPLLGGIAIFAAFSVGFSIILIFSNGLDHLIREIIVFLFGGLLVLLLGIYDDMRGAHWFQKLFIQLVAASIVIGFGYKISIIANPIGGQINLGLWSIPFTLLWIVGITNSINLIDGLDGLAAGISFGAACIMVFISLYFGNLASAFPAAILAGSLAAFLIFNVNPAKIFLGDSGSLFLGFILASFSINGTFRDSSAVAMLIPIIVLGIPITDTLLAFLRRIRKRTNPFVADREHIHHRLLHLGLSHKQAVLAINLTSYLWGVIAVVLFTAKSNYRFLLLIVILTTLIWGMRKLKFSQYFAVSHKNKQ